MPKKKVRIPVLIGIILFISGSILLGMNARRRVNLMIDGVPSVTRTARITVADILKEAGISWSTKDRIFPNLNYWMTEDCFLRVDHLSEIQVQNTDGTSQTFASPESMAGNILLDGKIRLFPGDQILWNGRILQPDEKIGKNNVIHLTIQPGIHFYLAQEGDSASQEYFTAGKTVGEALKAIMPETAKNTVIEPAEDTPLTDGMTIEISSIHLLTITADGVTIQAASSGRTVGSALARAGIPLQQADYSIPDENSALPDDGIITIVRSRNDFTVDAVSKPYTTEWIADDSADLGTQSVVTAGQNGITGKVTHILYENGIEKERTTGEEHILSEPVNAVMKYGTKIQIRTVDTPDGPLEYWRAVPVYATAYSPCRSGVSKCINGTASGRKVEKGVVAVTQAWYRLLGGLSVYIPGYGKAVIGDTGGSASGNNAWIDLAYSDDDFTGWSENTTLYFLTPVPENIPYILP